MFKAILSLLLLTGSVSARVDVNIDNGWRFVGGSIDGSNIDEIVNLPHTWNATDAASGYDYFRGGGTYTRDVLIQKEDEGQRFFLKFEGAQTVADVYVNDAKIGQHRGGYTAFAFEITDHVRVGEQNTIRVEVNNEKTKDVIPLAGDFTLFGGLHRSVRLLTSPPICITPIDHAGPGVYLRQRDVSSTSAQVDVTAKVSNASADRAKIELRVKIADADGHIVGSEKVEVATRPGRRDTGSVTISIENPRLWDGLKSPHLYAVTAQILLGGEVLDEVVQPLGLRTFRFDRDKGFFLNGKHLKLQGVSRHQDVKGKGAALSVEDHRRDLDLILDMGANSVRLAHYPHSEFFYNLCDSAGLVVWSEIPWVGSTDSGFDSGGPFATQTRLVTYEMIRQNFNHPSVVMWGVYNELSNPEDASPVPLIKELETIAKAEDPDRVTTAASFLWDDDPMHAATDVIAWNQYHGWYYGQSSGIGTWLDDTYERYPEAHIGVSEYGAGGSVNHHAEKMVRPFPAFHEWHPERYQAHLHETSWKEIAARDFVWGSYVWNMFDFSASWRREGDALGINDKGMVTYDRGIRKDAFYFYRANWSDAPTLHIADRRYRLRTSEETQVRVYSNANEVELNVNGLSLGIQKGATGVFRWGNVPLVKGNNVVLATASIGATVHEDRVVWMLDGSSVLTNYLIPIFQWWLKPILVLSLLFAFVAAGQGWKAGLAGWRKWVWRIVSAACALLFVAIIGGWIYGLTTYIDIFEYSLL